MATSLKEFGLIGEQGLFIAQGVGVTLVYTVTSFLLGLGGGGSLAILRYYHKGRWLVDGCVSVIRGTPLMLQLSLFYFCIPQWTGMRLSLFQAGILAFGLNSTAYITEILRGGIQSLPKGQFEVARALGIPRWLMWRDIIMPQLMGRTFPALVNEGIALLKETAIISTLGEMDIMRRAQSVSAQSFDYLTPLVLAGLCYYVLVLSIERGGAYLEKRWFRAFPS